MRIKSFKEALEKSIKQWQDIVAGGKYLACPLCTWSVQRRHAEAIPSCADCVEHKIWGASDCFKEGTPYKDWEHKPSKSNAAKVRDALIAALKRVEAKEK